MIPIQKITGIEEAPLVDKTIGNAYKVVELVAKHLPDISYIARNLDAIMDPAELANLQLAVNELREQIVSFPNEIAENTLNIEQLKVDTESLVITLDRVLIDIEDLKQNGGGGSNAGLVNQVNSLVMQMNLMDSAIRSNTQLVNNAQASASAASTLANKASSTAETAKTAVDNMNTAVVNASAKADSALTTATTASTNASTALTKATEAKAAADGVASDASAALTKATEAKTVADGVASTATAAKTAADQAMAKATSVESAVSGYSSRITAVENSVVSLTTTVGTAVTNADTALNKATAAETAASGLVSRIAAVEVKATNLETSVTNKVDMTVENVMTATDLTIKKTDNTAINFNLSNSVGVMTLYNTSTGSMGILGKLGTETAKSIISRAANGNFSIDGGRITINSAGSVSIQVAPPNTSSGLEVTTAGWVMGKVTPITTKVDSLSAGFTATWSGTQAQYDAITAKDPHTLYIVVP